MPLSDGVRRIASTLEQLRLTTSRSGDEAPPRADSAPSSSGLGEGRCASPSLTLPASLTLAFGTASMESYVSNWLAFARRVPELKPYAVVALDEALEKTCAGWGEPVVSASALLEPLGGEVARLLKSVKSCSSNFCSPLSPKVSCATWLKEPSEARVLKNPFQPSTSSWRGSVMASDVKDRLAANLTIDI